MISTRDGNLPFGPSPSSPTLSPNELICIIRYLALPPGGEVVLTGSILSFANNVHPPPSFFFLFLFFFQDFIYCQGEVKREQKQGELESEGEICSLLSKRPDAGLNPRLWDQLTEPLRHHPDPSSSINLPPCKTPGSSPLLARWGAAQFMDHLRKPIRSPNLVN